MRHELRWWLSAVLVTEKQLTKQPQGGSWLEGTLRPCRGGHVEFTVRKHNRINAGVPFVLFVQSGTPSHGTVLLTLRVDLLTLINFI